MIALVVIGWILLGIIGLVLLLLLILSTLKLTLRVGYCEKFFLHFKIGPVPLDLTDSLGLSTEEEDLTPKKKRKKTQAPQKTDKEKKEKTPTYPQKPSLQEVVNGYKDMVLDILRLARKHIRLENLRLRVLVATSDAAQTAIVYGSVCSAAGLVQTAAEALPRTDPEKVHIDVECDFLAAQPEVDAELHVSMRAWRLALILWRYRTLHREAQELLAAYQYFKKIEKTERNGNTNGNPNETTD